MCNCIPEFNDRMTAVLRQEKTNSEVEQGQVMNTVLNIKQGELRVVLDFRYAVRKIKKDGGRGASVNRTAILEVPFCPFCGNKYEGDE